MITNDKYEKELKNHDNVMIMNSVCNRFSKSLNKDDLHRCKLIALWKAMQTWKPEKGRKFTTFLYQKLYWECVKEVNAKSNIKTFNTTYCDKKTYDKVPMFEILDGLPTETQDIIRKRYIDRMTLQQIGNIYGCSYETIRKRLKKGIDSLKNEENGV